MSNEQTLDNFNASLKLLKDEIRKYGDSVNEMFELNDRSNQVTEKLSDAIEDYGQVEDENDQLGVAQFNVIDGIRRVKGGARVERLAVTHNFETIERLNNDSSMSDAMYVSTIRAWNPPTEKAASYHTDGYTYLIESLNEYSAELKLVSDEMDNEETVYELISLVNDARIAVGDVLDVLTEKIASDNVSAHIKQLKNNCVSEARAAGIISKRFNHWRDKKHGPAKSLINNDIASLLQTFKATNAVHHVRFRSKKKLADSQKEWNEFVRSHVSNLKKLLDALASLYRNTENDFDAEEIHAELESYKPLIEDTYDDVYTIASRSDEYILPDDEVRQKAVNDLAEFANETRNTLADIDYRLMSIVADLND